MISERWIVSQFADCKWMDRRTLILGRTRTGRPFIYRHEKRTFKVRKQLDAGHQWPRTQPRTSAKSSRKLQSLRSSRSTIPTTTNRRTAKSGRKTKGRMATVGMENLVKFAFVFLISDSVACLQWHIIMVVVTRVAGTIINSFLLQGVLLTGNSDFFVSDGRCKTAHRNAHVSHTQHFLVRVAQGLARLKCLFDACSECVTLKECPSISHAMCRTLLDPLQHLHRALPAISFNLRCPAAWPIRRTITSCGSESGWCQSCGHEDIEHHRLCICPGCKDVRLDVLRMVETHEHPANHDQRIRMWQQHVTSHFSSNTKKWCDGIGSETAEQEGGGKTKYWTNTAAMGEPLKGVLGNLADVVTLWCRYGWMLKGT